MQLVQIQIACLAVVLAWLFHSNVTSHFLTSSRFKLCQKHHPHLDTDPSIFMQQMFPGHARLKNKQTDIMHMCQRTKLDIIMPVTYCEVIAAAYGVKIKYGADADCGVYECGSVLL